MATRKTITTKKTAKSEAEISPTAQIGAFDSVAEPVKTKRVKKTPAKTAAPKKKSAVSTVVETAGKVKKAVTAKPSTRKRLTRVTLDPFADVVGGSSVSKLHSIKAEASNTSSGTKATAVVAEVQNTVDVSAELASKELAVELSPVFKALAEPTLPELKRENRARLQMQTPTRLYFYWSIKQDPWHMLRVAFGNDIGSYTLVLKLTDLVSGADEIYHAQAEGDWWFSVRPEGRYQAEIGFYAPNRPYFRIIYSNIVETPRLTPSPRVASEADWSLTADRFAEVLHVAGFSRDAFDVAMAGDDERSAESAAFAALTVFLGGADHDLSGIAAVEVRNALTAFAAGRKLEDLRWKISPALFAILQSHEGGVAGQQKAMEALTEHFDIDEADLEWEEISAAVFGASLIHFPRTLKTRAASIKYSPLSSFGINSRQP
ncbi:MAG: DUF4912 domain-containing protein [Pyrinomonadaceae bacterium]